MYIFQIPTVGLTGKETFNNSSKGRSSVQKSKSEPVILFTKGYAEYSFCLTGVYEVLSHYEHKVKHPFLLLQYSNQIFCLGPASLKHIPKLLGTPRECARCALPLSSFLTLTSVIPSITANTEKEPLCSTEAPHLMMPTKDTRAALSKLAQANAGVHSCLC